jgi:uncharacterized protein (TIGR02246 family)
MNADDHFAILELFARYAWTYDRGDAEAHASVYTEDGVMQVSEGDVEGRAAITERVKALFTRRGENGWQHQNDHLHIEGDEIRARVYSYWMVMEQFAAQGGHQIRNMGYHVTDCVKVGGSWYIKRRAALTERYAGVPWAKP